MTNVESRAARGNIRGKLFRKYLLLIFLPTGVAVAAANAISTYFIYREILSDVSSVPREKAIKAAWQVQQSVGRIAQQLAYATLPQPDTGDIELQRLNFLKLLRQVPEVTSIARVDATGREQVAFSGRGLDLPPFHTYKNRCDEPAFRNAKRGKPWFSPVMFRSEAEPYMTIAIRYGTDGGPVTIADVDLRFTGVPVSVAIDAWNRHFGTDH